MSANIRFLCSLALSDLLCGVCAFLDDARMASILSCSRRVFNCLMVTAHLTALLSILGLAVDHYLAICQPLYHRTDDNVSRVSVVIVLTWIISCLASLVDYFVAVNNYFFLIYNSDVAFLSYGHTRQGALPTTVRRVVKSMLIGLYLI